MPKLETKPVDFFKLDPVEAERHNDADATSRLGDNMKAHGQIHPVGAVEDGEVIWGTGRVLAARAAGLKTLDTKIFPASTSAKERAILRASENLQRKDYTAHQRWRLAVNLSELNGWSQKELAENLQLDESSVTRMLSPSKCISDVQAALKDGKLSISDCYAISKLPPEDQPGLLALKLSGASRDALERHGRRKRAAQQPVVRASKIRCPLPSGPVVTVAGGEISLDDAIEALKDATKAMTKARDTGLDASTAQRVWADMAKASV